MIALWARRSQEKYFDNSINNALINERVLRSLVPDASTKRPVRILVMDDIVGTQRTFKQLVEYFEEQLGEFYTNVELRFVFLFTSREETIDDLSTYLLSHDDNIAKKYKAIELEAVTGKSDLPYRKSIHYGSITPSQDRDELGAQRHEITVGVTPSKRLKRRN